MAPRTGDRIDGLEAAAAIEGVSVFHAGTALDDEGSLRHRRRARPRGERHRARPSPRPAARAYAAVDRIGWEGMQYRTDIAPPRCRGRPVPCSGAAAGVA